MSNFPDYLTVPMVTYSHFWKRFIGMMFLKKRLPYGICFPRCNSIHTFFMRQAIDVVMTDKEGTILYFFPSVAPWRVILPKKGVFYTYEFSLGLLSEERKQEMSSTFLTGKKKET